MSKKEDILNMFKGYDVEVSEILNGSICFTKMYGFPEEDIKCPTCQGKSFKIHDVDGNKLFYSYTCNDCEHSFNVIPDREAYQAWELRKQPPMPKCPKCGSTAIATGARGFNLMSGMLGASKTVNRCANCGHAWKPNGK